LGEDVGNLVTDAVLDHLVGADDMVGLADTVLAAAVTGLRDGGWHGDEALVRLGMYAVAVKYDWLTPWMLAVATADRQLAYGDQAEVDAATASASEGRPLSGTAGERDGRRSQDGSRERTAAAKSSGASCGRLWPTPGTTRWL
jgi:hypothetical protein